MGTPEDVERLEVLWRSELGAEEVRDHPPPSGVRIHVETDAERAVAASAGARVLVDGHPSDALLDAPHLRAVIVPYAGVEAGLRAQVAARPHLRLYNSHFNAPFVAQHAAALLLACAGRLGRYDRALRQGDWSGHRDGPASLHLGGAHALLLGYGAIGSALAPMLRGLGMRLTALRRRPDPAATDPAEVGRAELHRALSEADAIVVTLPSTPDTDGLLDAAAFEAIRPGALLVNVGRGTIIEEAALWQALEDGRLGGVGLDVWWQYPPHAGARRATLPSSRPFHIHEDVVMSPHRANAVKGWRDASVRDVLRTLAVLAAGRERNRVDPETGY